MQATGIVRRIDDLGRIVIPKEVRKQLHIKEGDPLEIFTTRQGEIILKPFEPLTFDKIIDLFQEFDMPQQKELLQKLIANIKE